MKRLFYYYILFLALCSLTSCEEKNDSLLITSTTQLTFDSDGGSQSFNIASNTDWSISSNAEWLTVSPVTGTGNQQVTITVAVSDNQLEEDAKLVVHTIDGEKIVNINVKVEGSYVRTGKHMDIRNHSSRLFLGGKAGSMDSLKIRSNVEWEVKGPAWIEAWDGERWRPLSQERGVIKGRGIACVYVRTAKDNKEEDAIEDILIVSEQYTGDFKNTINVEQMGRLETRPNNVQTLADGIAFEWICGCDVKKIYFRVTDKEIKIDSKEEVRQNFDVTYPDYINSIDGMRANSSRVIMTWCEDSQGNLGIYINSYTMHSGSGQVRARADIVDAKQLTGNQWRIYTQPDEETSTFYVYATNNPNSAFAYNTPILYHIYIKNLDYAGIQKKFKTGGYSDWKMPTESNEIHVLTLSRDQNGNLSDYINRYDRYYDADGNMLPTKPLLDRIPKSKVNDISLR